MGDCEWIGIFKVKTEKEKEEDNEIERYVYGNMSLMSGGIVYGNKFIINVNSENYDELIEEIISEAEKRGLRIKVNWTSFTINDHNVTSLTVKGIYEGRESFFSEIERILKENRRR